MVGHLEVPTIEPQKGLPSSLSRKVVSGLLVNDLGFQGLVFTDALAMKGVSGNEMHLFAGAESRQDFAACPPAVLGRSGGCLGRCEKRGADRERDRGEMP